MNAPTTLIAELRDIATQGWSLAAPMRTAAAAGLEVAWQDQEDHRAAVYAAVIDSLNCASPGLGTALHTAMYPIATTRG